MYVRLGSCTKIWWWRERRGFNHQVWTWNEHQHNVPSRSIMVSCDFFPQSFFVSSKWTQRNRFLINFTTLHWTTLLVRIQLHSSSTPNWVLWVHNLLWKVCKNASQAVPNIVYHPLSDIHKDEIKTIITQYNKFDTKVPIFAIFEYPQNVDHITLHKLRKWEDI